MKKIIAHIKAYAPPMIWALVIFILSSQSTLPGFEQSPYDFLFKKSAHIFVYFVLYILLKRATDLTISPKSYKMNLYLPLFLCLVYAMTDEFHQSLVPGRYATLRDVGYDMFGVGIAFLRKYDYI